MLIHHIQWECLHSKGCQPPTQAQEWEGELIGEFFKVWIGHLQKKIGKVPFSTLKSCIQGLNNTSIKFHFGMSSNRC